MRYDTWLEELSARPGHLLLVFLGVLIFLHFLLVRWLKFDDIAWKKVDYIWLGAAALGLLAASAQAERALAARYLENQTLRTATAYAYLRATLAGPPSVCISRVRSQNSPTNFDEIVKEQEETCRFAKAVSERMAARPETFLPLSETGYEPVGVNATHERSFARDIAQQAAGYAKEQVRYAELKSASEQTHLELLFTILGPLLIAFALALRITKVTGEITNARAKSAA